jgi:hypothetical protein
MDVRTFRQTLESHGIARDVSDAIVDYVDDQKSDLVTGQKLELEMTKLRGEFAELRAELRGEMAQLRAELRAEMRGELSGVRADLAGQDVKFERLRADTTRLVLGTSGLLGLLIIAMRFLPATP